MKGNTRLGATTVALSVLLLGCSNGGGSGGGFAATSKSTTPAPVTSSTAPAPTFQVGATMQTARGLHTATLLASGRVLIVGGIDPSATGATLVTESEIYDPTAGTFTNVSNPSLGGNPGGYMMIQDPKGNPFPVGRASHTATLLGDGRVLICGGFGFESFDANGNPLRTEMTTAFTFSPTTNTFTATQGKLNMARSEHSAVLLPTGEVLIAGGVNSTLNNGQGGTLQSGEVFDPTTGIFTALSATGLDMIAPRQDCGAAATATGALLVGGEGLVAPGQTTVQTVIELGAETFRASQNNFISTPGPTASRAFASLTNTSAGFVLAGGVAANGPVPGVEELNSQLTAWAPIAQLKQTRAHHAAAANDQGVLLAGGVSFDAQNNLVNLASAEFLSVGTNVSEIVSMTYARNGAAATTLTNGTILVTGGLAGGTKNVQGLDATSAVAVSEIFTLPGASATTTIATTTPGATVPPPPAPNLPTIRVAAGSKSDYTDSLGNDWSADNGFTGGVTADTSDMIVGTNDPALYKNERNGNMTYQFAVPNGAYAVTLKFAEIYWGSAGKRVFNVTINGSLVLNGFDIFAAAGDKDVAFDQSFPVTVTNGQVQIQFTTVKDNAKIAAIVIGPPSTAVTTTTPVPTRPTIRVAAGNGSPYGDSLGNVWSADTGFVGGVKARTTDAISGTADAQLYQNERNGNMEYGFALPNGNYTVTLKFAEIYWGSAGKRIFNVALDGSLVLTNFDVFAAAGGKDVAFDQSFPVTVSNGRILIQFTTVKDNAKISAIEIAPR